MYFKSTDGHVGTYAMSLKRLNLSLIELLHEHGGCILVDSSVRKTLPDSFSRTIPIWCAVMNRIALKYRTELGVPLSSSSCSKNVNDDDVRWDTALHTPSPIVPPEEYLEISNLIDSRVELLYQSKAIVDVSRFVDIMTTPIRAIWVANESMQHDTINSLSSSIDADKYFTIVCCNPSHYNTDGGRHIHKIDNCNERGGDHDKEENAFNQQSYFYIPGAADDEASWSRNLTPELFWMNREKILDPTLTEDETDVMIDSIVHDSQMNLHKNMGSIEDINSSSDMDRIGEMNLWIGSRRAGRPPECWERFDAVLNVSECEYPNMQQSIEENRIGSLSTRSFYYLQLPIDEGKKDKHNLERWMPVGLVFIGHHLQQNRRVLVHCAQGRDPSVAIVLSFVALYCIPSYPLSLKPEFDSLDFGSVLSDTVELTTKDHQHLYLQSGMHETIVNNLLQDGGKEMFLRWMHTSWQQNNPLIEPFADKDSLRIALHLVKQTRENAEPTRSTMQKLNRFFMSSPFYR